MKGFSAALLVLLVLAAVVVTASLVYTGRLLTPAVATSDRVAMTPRENPDGPGGAPDSAAARNVILFVGDGMGLPIVHAARLRLLGPTDRLVMERMPVVGLADTHAYDDPVTDSAAGATALSAGVKTRNGMVGMTPDTVAVSTVLEAALATGRAGGLVTTSYLPDATPAAFAAHAPSRDHRVSIARQFVGQGIDVLLGGGLDAFLATGLADREGVPVEAETVVALAERAGYRVARSPQALPPTTEPAPVLGLFAAEALDPETPGAALVDLTRYALDRLADDPEGFFLLVEQEHTDISAHENDLDGVTEAVLALDAAVEAALEFAAADGRTLVVVTADHDTGGLTIPEGAWGRSLRGEWATFGHTATPVPVFAYGPGSAPLGGVIDNTDVARTMAAAMGVALGRPTDAR